MRVTSKDYSKAPYKGREAKNTNFFLLNFTFFSFHFLWKSVCVCLLWLHLITKWEPDRDVPGHTKL